MIDHLRSVGPWMVSIDAEPLVVLDGMSQTATVVGGFAEDPVVRAYVEGELGDTLVHNDDTAVAETWAVSEYAQALRQLVPGLPHVTFVASGAEANEKAMALCRINCARKDATRVLAFEGSFHGRRCRACTRRTRRARGARARRLRVHVRAVPGRGDEPVAPSAPRRRRDRRHRRAARALATPRTTPLAAEVARSRGAPALATGHAA